MRHLLLILFVLFGPANLLANPIGTSSAVLDWTNFRFTVGGSLVISYIDYVDGPPPPFINSAIAATSGGTSQGFDRANASADFAYSNNLGHATASASAVNGLLQSSAEAGANSTSYHFARSSTFIANDFWLYGSGTGTLTATLPYRLTAMCSPPAFNELSSANSGVGLSVGPGFTFGQSVSANLSCTDGPSTKTGDLTVTRSFDNPTWGPLVGFDAATVIDAVVSVPDSVSTSVLFAIGLLGVGVMARLVRRVSW